MLLKLSIITVNLNNADGLRKTIDSVINQTYTHFEHIIIDGGSIDGSVEVIKEYEAIYKEKQRHLYWVSEPDKGIYNGMNKGIKVAKGEYCLFLNSGDWLYNEYVINKFSNLNRTEDVIYGKQYADFNGQPLTPWRTVPEKLDLTDLIFGALPHQSMFFKTKLFGRYGGYNENYTIISDWEYYLNLLINTNTLFKKIDIFVSVFDTNGISKKPELITKFNKERTNSLYTVIPECFHSIITENIELKEKYNGLMNSNTVKYALKLSRLLKHLGYNKT